MCGITAIVGTSPVNQRLYDALTVLQHRGQDAAGIVTVADGLVSMRKGKGLVRDVFGQQDMLELRGDIGIGHVRYPTAGCDSASEAQPFYVNAPYGLVLGHNGNLTNAAELADVLVREERRHLNTSSDSEVLLNVLASELQRVGTPRITAADVFAAVTALYRRCRGGYAVVAMVVGHGILGFRDPHGIRPLVLGRRDTAKGPEYMLASESVALDMLGFGSVRDIAPGEAVFIDEHGRRGIARGAQHPTGRGWWRRRSAHRPVPAATNRPARRCLSARSAAVLPAFPTASRRFRRGRACRHPRVWPPPRGRRWRR